jgi:soluble lytic murein transglycosylase-like protein
VSSTVARGGYVVQPGDTLWGLAAREGVSVASLAAANGLSPSAYLITGHVLSLTGAAASASSAAPTTSVSVAYVPSSTAAQEPVGSAAQGDPTGPPYPTPERLTASQVGTIGANNGATYSLTDAIGWEESGFNNDLVSSADARGIMQILPGTWNWIQNSLAGGTLAPASAADNVRGGSLMLHWLLRQTGGDPAMAAAGYYQGLSSVQRHGMYRDTQRYVQNVLALRSRFGGG